MRGVQMTSLRIRFFPIMNLPHKDLTQRIDIILKWFGAC